MTISYPLTHPTDPTFSRVVLRPRSSVAAVTSPFTLETQVQAHQGQIWQADLELPPMDRDQAEEWTAFLLSLNGREGTFHLGDPTAATPRGNPVGTPVVDGASQTGLTLATRGWTANATGVLLAGDYIQLGTGTSRRLYKVLVDADADASGDATLDIWPRLRESPADGASITTSSCKGTFRLASNEMAWDASPGPFYSISLTAVEAI